MYESEKGFVGVEEEHKDDEGDDPTPEDSQGPRTACARIRIRNSDAAGERRQSTDEIWLQNAPAPAAVWAILPRKWVPPPVRCSPLTYI